MAPMTSHLEAHEHAAPMAAGPTGPLQGMRIIDVTHALAGPFAGMFLADLGADVIKVEPPTGEMTRFGGPWTRDDEERLYSGGYASPQPQQALDLPRPDQGRRPGDVPRSWSRRPTG